MPWCSSGQRLIYFVSLPMYSHSAILRPCIVAQDVRMLLIAKLLTALALAAFSGALRKAMLQAFLLIYTALRSYALTVDS